MQVLTGQWSKLYTHKLRIDYTDFTIISSTRTDFVCLSIPRGYQVVGCKIWIRTTFVRAGMSTCTMYLINQNNIAQTGEASRSPVIVNALQTVTDFSGNIGFATQPMYKMSSANNIIVRLVHTSLSAGVPYTAGSFDIWITTMKMT